MFSRTYKNSSVVFFEYDNILLKLYLEIAKTGDFTRLVKEGKAGSEKCLDVWENIVKKQQQVTGNNQYDAFFRLNKGYLINLNDYTMIRACLILVGINYLYIDWEYIKILKEKGYSIDTSTPERILETVKYQLQVCEKLITKSTSKRKELDMMIKGGEESKTEISFESMLANLNYALGFNVNEDLTLCRYNEYQKIITAKNKSLNGRN